MTLTPGDAGSTLVTVTASDGIASNAPAEQQFAVTVTAGPLTVTSAEGRAPGRPWPVCENTDGAFFSVTNPYSAKTLAVSLDHAKDGEVQGYVPAPPLDRDLDLSISLAGSTAPLTSFTVARGATVVLQARAADDADAVNGVLKASFRLDGTELGRVYLREIDWEGGDTWNVCRYNQPPETVGTNSEHLGARRIGLPRRVPRRRLLRPRGRRPPRTRRRRPTPRSRPFRSRAATRWGSSSGKPAPPPSPSPRPTPAGAAARRRRPSP